MLHKELKKCFPLFVLPTLLAFTAFFIWPFLHGLYLSFCQFTDLSEVKWVGFANYAHVFSDTGFWKTFGFTLEVALVTTFIVNVLAFLIAMALTEKIKGANLFRSAFFLPNLIGGIVLGYIWQILINCLLSYMEQPLLALNTMAGFWALIIVQSWQQIGYMMVIYIAGMQNIPEELIEAAKIDGANKLQTLFKIKIPVMMPYITICLFLTLTSAFKQFDQNLSLTAGEPAHATEMMALNVFNTFYARAGAMWKGVGQAKSVIFFLIILCIAFAQLRATKSKEVQQ